MKLATTLLLALVAVIMPARVDAQSSAGTATVAVPTPQPTAGEREEATGTITDVTPDRALVLHTGTNAGEPLVFRFAPQVTYVDEDGRVVEAAGLRKNLRVRVSYIKAGADNVIEKVTILQ